MQLILALPFEVGAGNITLPATRLFLANIDVDLLSKQHPIVPA